MSDWSKDQGTSLFPSREYREAFNYAMEPVLDAAIDRVKSGFVVPTFDYAAFCTELGAFDFAEPMRLDDAVQWVIDQLETGLVHINHPRYFGLFNPAPSFPAQVAERVSAAFNPQLATWTTSPAAVAIEKHIIASLAARAGLPDTSRGHFTSGGSEANYTAVLMALTHSCPDFALSGARGFAGQPMFYVSRESHLAWIKIAHQAGIGRSAVRLVPTDGTGRMDIAQLAEMITTDRHAGCVPVMIAATAGTTIAGMIDPLVQCATMAQGEGLWFHVDAAWGGAVLASDKLRSILAGIELADSITIDAHKWWATTMACGIFITRHATVLSETFYASTTFMPSNIADTDPYVTSVQWSRRFLGLRLFLSLAAVGWAGYGDHVEHMLAMSEMLKIKMRRVDWFTVNESSLGVVCLMPPTSNSVSLKHIVARILASGEAWVSIATFEHREVIRACVTSGQTKAGDIDSLVTALLEAADHATTKAGDT